MRIAVVGTGVVDGYSGGRLECGRTLQALREQETRRTMEQAMREVRSPAMLDRAPAAAIGKLGDIVEKSRTA